MHTVHSAMQSNAGSYSLIISFTVGALDKVKKKGNCLHISFRPASSINDIRQTHQQSENVMPANPEETIAVLSEWYSRQFQPKRAFQLPTREARIVAVLQAGQKTATSRKSLVSLSSKCCMLQNPT